MDPEAEVIMIVRLTINDTLQPMITCRIVLTSPAVRSEDDTTENATSVADQLINEPKKGTIQLYISLALTQQQQYHC